MKYKDPITGELKDIIVKSGDTLPIGTIVEFDGETVPDGYEEFETEDYGSLGNIIVDDVTCKNILPNNVQSQTINGVTITRGKDGSLTLNGTSTAGTYVYLVQNANIKLKTGTYVLSTHKSGSVDTNAYLQISDASGTVIGSSINFVSETREIITLTEDTYIGSAHIYFGSGRTFNNLKIYPMLEKGDAETNYVEHKEFENDKDSGVVTVVENLIEVRRIGKLCMLSIYGDYTTELPNNVATQIGTIPAGFRPYRALGNPMIIRDSKFTEVDKSIVTLGTEGAIKIRQKTGATITPAQLFATLMYFTDNAFPTSTSVASLEGTTD